MNILTPTGYRDIATCSVGDEVCAFDPMTGAQIVNTIETLAWIDATEWERWWEVEETCPPFQFYKINDKWTLNSEQRVWRNGINVCHAKDLVVGDVLHDGSDHDVVVTSVEPIVAEGWWRFDISDDHSYIIDDLTVHNASVFWVGATGTWDSSTTTHWSASSGGAGGAAVPGSADVALLDGSSGGGTVTMNFGGTVTLQSLQMGAFTGTWDNSVNNNNFTLTVGSAIAASASMVLSGSSTRTYKFGTATYTLSATGASQYLINMGVATNATVTAGSETWVISGVTQNQRNLNYSGSVSKAFGALTMNANTGIINFNAGTQTFTTITASGGVTLTMGFGVNITCTTLALNGGSSGKQIGILPSTLGSQNSSAISVASGTQTLTWCAIKDTAFTGGATFTANNSFDLGDNSGIAITAPGGGGGGGLAPAPIVIARGTPY